MSAKPSAKPKRTTKPPAPTGRSIPAQGEAAKSKDLIRDLSDTIPFQHADRNSSR